MTDFNQLAAPRFADGVRRLLGEDVQMATVAPELAPYMSLQSDRPEWQVLWGEIPWISWRATAALAANFSSVIVTPVDATRLSVVKKLIIINATAGVLEYRFGMVTAPVIDTQSKVASRDLRRLGVVTAFGSRQQVADLLPSVQPVELAANSQLVIDIDFMLSTSSLGVSALVIQGNVVNQIVRAGVVGYERALRPEEIQLD